MKYNILATGSDGNAVVVNGEILIDCGVTFKKIEPYLSDLKLVLITHTHVDHLNLSTMRKIAENRPTVWIAGNSEVCEKIIESIPKLLRRRLIWMDTRKSYTFGYYMIIPVMLQHDVLNYGFKIFHDGEKMFYATDTATLDNISASDYDLYMVEANFEKEDLKNRIEAKDAIGMFAYERRVWNSHLSKESCDAWLSRNNKKGEVVYLHQHKDKA